MLEGSARHLGRGDVVVRPVLARPAQTCSPRMFRSIGRSGLLIVQASRQLDEQRSEKSADQSASKLRGEMARRDRRTAPMAPSSQSQPAGDGHDLPPCQPPVAGLADGPAGDETAGMSQPPAECVDEAAKARADDDQVKDQRRPLLQDGLNHPARARRDRDDHEELDQGEAVVATKTLHVGSSNEKC